MDEGRVRGLEDQRNALLARLAHIDAELSKELGAAETATVKPAERAVKPRATRKTTEKRDG